MSEAVIELSSFFELTEVTPEAYEHYADAAYASFHARERFEELLKQYQERVAAGEGDSLLVGLGWLILGRFSEALEWLGQAPDTRQRHYYSAKALSELGRLEEAQATYRQASVKGWDTFEIDLLCAGLNIRAGKIAVAEKLVEKRTQEGQDRGEWYFVNGLLKEQAGDRPGAVEEYEKALTLSPDHAPAMFNAARLYDMLGDDDQAIELYERLALQPQAHINALINLAVVYEDRGKYEGALTCLRRVLKAFPNHTRARLFLKDVESCCEMVIDDLTEKRTETRNRLLDAPISEFELSVRARNCLKKMKIHTLGDLVRLTEAELLAYKNFGETSLNEIKQLLTQRGLRLGQPPEEIDVEQLGELVPPAPEPPPAGSEALLSKPVSELELSVRARRCLQRLNIVTLGDLVQRTEAELLATRNFGVTSLTEIASRLTERGLSLAPKRAE